MQVKTQKQVIALQNKVQKVADQLNEEIIAITKGIQHIQTQTGVAYQLNTKDFDTKKLNLIAKKVGDDLEVTLEENVVIFDNYFNVCTTDLSCLVSLPTKDGGLYHIVVDAFFTLEDGTQVVYFYGEQSIVSTESSAVSTDNKQSFFDVVTSNIGIVAAVAVVAVVVATSGSDKNNNDDEVLLTFTLADTGGTTNNATITVSSLKEGATWQYSIDGGASFTDGTGSSFVLNEGTYAENVIQIKQTDTAGNILIIIKNTSPVVVDTTNPLFTSATTVDVKTNTEASETIYEATATDNNAVTYTLEDGNQKDKFTISKEGELRYKQKQTTAHNDDKVTIIATDTAGNETKQLVTVSVKDFILSTSVIWNNIGDDNNINIAELAMATLSGTVTSADSAFTDLNITSIVFKQNNAVVHTINTTLPVINNNTWTLGHDNAWASKLVDGNCTVVVNLSANSNSITGQGKTVVAIDIVAPDTPVLNFTDTGLSNDGVTKNGTMTVGDLEAGATWQYSIDGGTNFTSGTGSSFILNEGTYTENTIQIKQTDVAGNTSSVFKNMSSVVVDTTNPLFTSTTTVDVKTNTEASETIYEATAIDNNAVTYTLEDGNQKDKFTISKEGELRYKQKQTTAHNDDKVTIIATDTAGNETRQLVTVSVKDFILSTSVIWNNIGDDNNINIAELAMATLSGTVTSADSAFTDLNITSIVFKQNNAVVHTINTTLPVINNNTWTLGHDNAWASKLVDGNCTVVVNLSANSNSITGQGKTVVAIDIVAPDTPVLNFTDTGLSNDGVTKNGTMTVGDLEAGATWQYSIDGGTNFTSGTGSSFILNEGTYTENTIQIKQTDVAGNTSSVFKNMSSVVVDTTNPLFTSTTTVDVKTNTEASETIYEATAIDNNAVTYTLEDGNQKDKFTISKEGELRYKQKQTTAHNDDKVTIIATDTAGNETRQLVTVSVKDFILSTSVIWNNIGDDNNINIAELAMATLSGTVTSADSAFTDLNITSIVFKQNNAVVHTINTTLPVINNNTWTLGHDNAWASKLVDGNCTVVVNLSANSNSITGQGKTVVAIDIVAPDTPVLNFTDTGLSNDGVTKNGTMTVGDLEAGATWQYSIDGGTNFTSGTGSSFILNEGTYTENTIQIKQTDVAGNTSSVFKNMSSVVVDTTNPLFTSTTTVDVKTNTEASETIYEATAIDNNAVTYTLEDGNQKDKFTISKKGELRYKQKQATAHNDDKVTIIATDAAGNETRQLVTVSVKDFILSTSVVWNNIGDDNNINIAELAMATLSGTVTSTDSTFTDLNIASIVFKQNNTIVHTINTALPVINNNTWTLNHDNAWASKLVDGNCIVIVNLSANSGGITGQGEAVVVIDIVAPVTPVLNFTDTGLSNDGITKNGTMIVGDLETGATWQYSIDGGTNFTSGTGSSFILNEGTYVENTIQIKQTDVAGNTSSVFKNISTIVVDTTPLATPTFTFVDTGSLDNDRITNNGTITVNGLASDATWQYSIDGGTNFTSGTGSSFMLSDGNYTENAIQIRQTDVAGNISSASVNTSTIVVDTTDPLFFSTGNTVNVRINSAVTTTIYDARVVNHTGGNADEGITYSIKGANASKFSITTDTGIVTYKTMQTVAHNDAITIVATDVAGNESEQSIVVSVKTLLQGFAVNGESAGDYSGLPVSSAGDVNGDGLDDLIVSAQYAENKAGKSYVVFGKVDGVAVDLSTIASGTGGFVINGENANDWSGTSVSSAGDVNGDGLDDLIVGAYKATPSETKSKAGKSYVVFGKVDGVAVDLSTIASGTGGFVINGENTDDWSGSSVSSAGDVNGDGLDDLIVGAHNTGPMGESLAGKSYVVFGKKDNTTAINLSTIASGTGGFVINGESANDYSGYPVSSVGDVNGDGLDDLIIGAFRADPDGRDQAGKSYVVFGKADGAAVDLSTIASGTGGFVINGESVLDESGFSVSSAGDVNGDGLDDLIVGACKATPSETKSKAGKSYVVFGKADGAAVDLSTIVSGTGGFVINGESAWDESGFSVSTAGDVNGDGLDDLIVGVYMAKFDGKVQAGKSYVVFGKADGAAVDLSTIASGTGGFVINGENAGDYSGYSVSSAGDVNGDGLDDLIIGAYGASPDGSGDKVGRSFVIFGKTDTTAVNLADISAAGGDIAHTIDFQGDANTDKNDTLTGTSADELFIAGLGNDVLTGNGGTDVFNAGAGDDTIIINADNLAKLSSKVLSNHLLARVDGGGNTDTLKLAGTDLTLDLTQIDNGRIQDIEIIDLTGSGDNILKLNLNDLLDISSSTNVLKVMGDAGDKVDIELSGNAFIQGSAETKDGITYDIYSNANASTAKLWIDQDLAVV